MNLNVLSETIEVELHNDQTISDNTKTEVGSVVNQQKALRGGGPRSLNPSKLKGLDRALLKTISNKLTHVDPKLRDTVLENIAANGQTLLPDNANIYYTHLLTDANALKKDVNEVLTEIHKIQGGHINDLMMQIMIGVTIVLFIVAIVCIVKYVDGGKKESFEKGRTDVHKRRHK